MCYGCSFLYIIWDDILLVLDEGIEVDISI